jgi:hypothetical protein
MVKNEPVPGYALSIFNRKKLILSFWKYDSRSLFAFRIPDPRCGLFHPGSRIRICNTAAMLISFSIIFHTVNNQSTEQNGKYGSVKSRVSDPDPLII